MAILKCKMCGADLHVNPDDKVVTCEYCGSTQTVPSIDNDKKALLFNRANHFRLGNEFSKAIIAYESIIHDFSTEAEAYWGLCLCKYGIEYVDDPKTKDKIPTCHRTLYTSIFDDEDFQKALEYSDVLSRDIYNNEAKEIDRLQKHIIKLSQKEDPYDIFICYKETDNDGNRTVDSVLAQDIYDKLVENNYKVFFARITLENKLGQEYEPIIFSALRSAKIMLCVGTKEQYFNAVWVKNEWNRYLDFMRDDNSKFLIPCYKDIDPYDMPEEFIALQSQNMSKIGYLQDLVRGVNKIFGRNNNSSKEKNNSANIVIDKSQQIQLDKAYSLINDGDFENAKFTLEVILTVNSSCVLAYIYKILIDRKFTSIEELIDSHEYIANDPIYITAYKYCDDDGKKQLDELANKSYDYWENYTLEIYNEEASKEDDNEIDISRIDSALEQLEEIDGYDGVPEIIDEINQFKLDYCNRVSDALYKESSIADAIDYIQNFSISSEKKQEIINDLSEKHYKKGIKLFNDSKYDAAKDIFDDILDYSDSADKSQECQFILNQNSYNYALDMIKAKDYVSAARALSQLSDFQDSDDLLKKCNHNIDCEKCIILTKNYLNEDKISSKDYEYLISKLTPYLNDDNEEINNIYSTLTKKRHATKRRFNVVFYPVMLSSVLVSSLSISLPIVYCNNKYKEGLDAINGMNINKAYECFDRSRYKGSEYIFPFVYYIKNNDIYSLLKYTNSIDLIFNNDYLLMNKKIQLNNQDFVLKTNDEITYYLNNKIYEFTNINSTQFTIDGFDFNIDKYNINVNNLSTYIVVSVDPIINTTNYKISYDLQDGSFNKSDTILTSYNRDTNYILPRPMKQGYVFKYWLDTYTNTKFDKINFKYNQNLNNLSLRAVYEIIYYELKVSVNNLYGRAEGSGYYTINNVVHLKGYVNKDCKFTGWYNKKTNSIVSNKLDFDFIMPASDVVLELRCIPNNI